MYFYYTVKEYNHKAIAINTYNRVVAAAAINKINNSSIIHDSIIHDSIIHDSIIHSSTKH